MELLSEQLDVMPGDLDESGQLAPYQEPVFETVYSEEELAQPHPPLESLVTFPEQGEASEDGFGTAQSGIAPPNNAHRASWMGTYQTVADLKIEDMILPGTHNSGFDKQAPRSPASETCQDVSPHVQLQYGIRALDLRVQFFSGYAKGDARRFSIFHMGTSGRTVQGDIIAAVNNLHRQFGTELVILDFHEFKNFTTAAHQELGAIIKTAFGSRLIEPSDKNLLAYQLWSRGKNIVIAYKSSDRDRLFWPGVNQRWIGSNTPSNNALRDFVSNVGKEVKPAGELRAIQAAKYSMPFFTPKDMSKETMSWFAAGSTSHPIMKHYIINTDWSLRNRLVDNCIYANQFRT
jgi:hypothetical protein